MTDFLQFLDDSIENLKKEEECLIQDARKDEANLARIQLNMYDIAKTVYSVFVKKSGVINAKEYMNKLDTFREKWQESYDRAKVHGDLEKMAVEEIKMAALDNIKQHFEQMC